MEALTLHLVEHGFRPHTHDVLMLGLIEAGTKGFERERETHVAPTGSVSVVNPGELHTGRRIAGEELRYRALYVPTPILAEAAAPFGSGRAGYPEFRGGVVVDPDVYTALVLAHEAITGRAPRLAQDELLFQALGLLSGRHAAWTSPVPERLVAPPAVGRAREFVAERFTEELPVAAVAAVAGLSQYHLMRQFRRHVGMPLHAYQVQLRIEHAKRMLADGVAVAEVALATGFADQSHLSKRFKDLVGLPPAAYRRTVTGDRAPGGSSGRNGR